MQVFSSALEMVSMIKPEHPVVCYRLAAISAAVGFFREYFPGEILYSIKTNPAPVVLDSLFASGVRRFEAASISEIKSTAEHFPDAHIAFMHPVKSRHAINEAYFRHDVRDFAFDTADELEKIMASTDGATDLGLFLRIAVPGSYAEMDFSNKFGAPVKESAQLLIRARQVALRLGACFHVGSQCLNPTAYGTALEIVGNLIRASGVIVEMIDIGGGFPSVYSNISPPPLTDFMKEIKAGFKDLPVGDACEFWSEPGRALVAEAGSTVVRVELQRGEYLYLNDGIYGGLYDAGTPGFSYPVKAIRMHGRLSREIIPFSFFGPTLDGADQMKGPFLLPADMREGDYVEIGMTGAYGTAMRTGFNGFDHHETMLLEDAPMLSMYGRRHAQLEDHAGVAPVSTLLSAEK